MSDEFAIRLQEGRAGEVAVRDYLAGRGWYVHDAATSACGVGCGPRMGSLTLPDLLIARRGHGALWVEVKAKRSSVWHKQGGYSVTGFATYALRRYQAIERETGIGVAVFFVHWGDEREVRCGVLSRMGAKPGEGCYSHEWPIGNVPHTLWKWDALRAVARVASAKPGPILQGEQTLAECRIVPLDGR